MYQPPEGSNFGPYPPTPQQGVAPGGPPVSGKEQAIMWQQGHYMGGESGFISASTTQPSSITGHEDDLESGANCFTGPGSITGSSIYDLDSAHVSGKSFGILRGPVVLVIFLKNGQSRHLFFVYFRPSLITISIIAMKKSIDGVLGIQTRGCRMVGADNTMELWR